MNKLWTKTLIIVQFIVIVILIVLTISNLSFDKDQRLDIIELRYKELDDSYQFLDYTLSVLESKIFEIKDTSIFTSNELYNIIIDDSYWYSK